MPEVRAGRTGLEVFWRERVGFALRLRAEVGTETECHLLDLCVPLGEETEVARALVAQLVDAVEVVIDEWFPRVADKHTNTGD